MNKLSAVIISSPAASNPSTALIGLVINSLRQLLGLDFNTIEIVIVLDGYKICANKPHTKKGRITSEMATAYEEYIINLKNAYESCKNVVIYKNDCHIGFAMCVQLGLSKVTTKYALVLQHDRIFVKPFTDLNKCLEIMEQHTHIRYIGIPSITNCNHESQLLCRYNIPYLTYYNNPNPNKSVHIILEEHNNIGIENMNYTSPRLQPLIFWYDSQHICHVERYLQIFKPFTNMTPSMKKLLTVKDISMFLLRSGDFIEDRFGQAQRNIMYRYR